MGYFGSRSARSRRLARSLGRCMRGRRRPGRGFWRRFNRAIHRRR